MEKNFKYKFNPDPCSECEKEMSNKCWEECIMNEEYEKTKKLIGFIEDRPKPKKKSKKPKIDINKFFEL